MFDIIPAILPKTKDDLVEKILSLDGTVPLIHIDVLSETFAPQDLVLGIEFEAHPQLLSDPMPQAREWAQAGAKRIIIHVEDFESDKKLSEAIAELKQKAEVGLALKLETPIEKLFAHRGEIDFVQLMAIDQIGKQGEEFDPKILNKIKALKEKFPTLIVSVDGGINDKNIHELALCGADRMVVGSAIFGKK
jgi:ribulose-phosphate 3-epimerase